jgi:hypothetical protein
MEESVWLYFGFVIAIVAIGIVTVLVVDFQEQGETQAFFDSARQLARQVDTVCKMPKDTQLSAKITVQSGSVLFTIADAVCAENEERRCFPTTCDMAPVTLIDLTSPEAKKLFSSHEYTCTVLHGETITVSCAG